MTRGRRAGEEGRGGGKGGKRKGEEEREWGKGGNGAP